MCAGSLFSPRQSPRRPIAPRRFHAPSVVSLRRRSFRRPGHSWSADPWTYDEAESASLVFDATAVSGGSRDRHRFACRKFLQRGGNIIFSLFNIGGIDRWFVVDRPHVGDHPRAIDDYHVRSSARVVEAPDYPVGVEEILARGRVPTR